MKLNSQKIEKRVASGDDSLAVVGVFSTIQGEGPFSGTAAVFVRLAGCNLRCPLCDTDYTTRKLYRPEQLLQEISDHHPARKNKIAAPLVVITGGEPLRQRIRIFINLLLGAGYRVQIETNGTYPPPILSQPYSTSLGTKGGAFLVVSPKTGKVNPITARLALAFKYVLSAGSVDRVDGLPIRALDHPVKTRIARPPAGKPVYLQPADHQDAIENRKNMKAAVVSASRNGYTLQLQIHKILGLE